MYSHNERPSTALKKYYKFCFFLAKNFFFDIVVVDIFYCSCFRLICWRQERKTTTTKQTHVRTSHYFTAYFGRISYSRIPIAHLCPSTSRSLSLGDVKWQLTYICCRCFLFLSLSLSLCTRTSCRSLAFTLFCKKQPEWGVKWLSLGWSIAYLSVPASTPVLSGSLNVCLFSNLPFTNGSR